MPSDSQPQAGSSTATATSSIGPDRSPRRSCREAGRRASQLLYAFYAPASRRKRRASAASSRGGPSSSTTPRLRSAPPSVQAPQPTSTTIANGTSTQDENYSEAGSSAVGTIVIIERQNGNLRAGVCVSLCTQSPLGKRRRDEVYIKKEEEDSESEDASPSKKARRVRNLRNRSTPARFDSPKVEPKEEPSSPNPFFATPIRKRALKDEDEDEENQPGPSKRGRFDPDGQPLTPPRTPIPAPALPSLLIAQPSETWSVQAQPSLSMIPTPQDTTGLPTPISTPPPSFVAVLGPMPTQAQGPPAVPPVPVPVPVQPTTLVRTYANIFGWERPAATELPTPTATPPPDFVAVLGPMPTQAQGPPAHPQVPVSDPVEPTPLVRTYAKIFEWERPRRQ